MVVSLKPELKSEAVTTCFLFVLCKAAAANADEEEGAAGLALRRIVRSVGRFSNVKKNLKIR